MKPSFTLSLASDGIALLHRAAGGWRSVGKVPLTSKDMHGELAMLRKTATSLEPGGLRCKVLIPNDQVRYLTIETPGLSDDERLVRAETTLEGATPYALSELAFDISPDGPRTHIAAVAKETLEEAESFASEHRFHPVSFVAAPGPNDFLGEPFFGTTQQIADLIDADDTVEPDGIAVVVIGAIETPVPAESAEPKPDDLVPAQGAIAPPAAPKTSGVTDGSVPSDEAPATGFATRRAPGVTGRSLPNTADLPSTAFAEGRLTGLTVSEELPKRAPTPTPRTVQSEPKPADTTPPPKLTAPASGGIKAGPRTLGLILAAAVLVILFAVAAWAALFLEDGIAGLFDKKDQVAVTAPVDPLPDDLPLTAPDTSLSDEDAAVLDALRRENAEPVPEPEPPMLTEEEFAARYAVTGIWPMAPEPAEPPALISLDDLYLTSIDPINLGLDAVALPDVRQQQTDSVIAALSAPAGAGVRFDLDDQGLVRPTPEGALSPEGHRVFAGNPPRVPPNRPDPQTRPAVVDPELQRLAAARPQARPEGLVENNERSTLGGLTRSELADYRPRLRPETVAATAASAAEAASAASLFSPGTGPGVSDDQELADDIADAIDVSIRPDSRPADFSNLIDRSNKGQDSETRTAAVAPQRVTPSIPSSASVTKQATVRNAINLRKINLVGVYGKPSDRRALVRLPNGRYQKVQVGDKIDGGQVSAIGDAELRYQKSGRNVVLKMP